MNAVSRAITSSADCSRSARKNTERLSMDEDVLPDGRRLTTLSARRPGFQTGIPESVRYDLSGTQENRKDCSEVSIQRAGNGCEISCKGIEQGLHPAWRGRGRQNESVC